MKKNLLLAGFLGAALLIGSVDCHAANWTKIEVDMPNKNVEGNYYDSDNVKGVKKTLSWTEKFVLTDFGTKSYTKHLSQYPACKKNIAKKGEVTHHQIDLEIKEGNFRLVAKRNYNKKNELVCTDKEMGTELDKSWRDVKYQSPMYNRYYILVTKYKLRDI